MITSILTLLGGGLGGLLRLAPEILKIFTAKQDNAHEYRMTQLQLEIDKARAALEIDKVHAAGEITLQSAEMAALTEALKSQGQLTKIKWVDALNSTVRPCITYWWMVLFTMYKGCTIWWGLKTWTTMEAFLAQMWTSNDAGILSMILSFWFVDRSIRYLKR